jgi:ribosomal protein S18 acetylase RimI-like enzyme
MSIHPVHPNAKKMSPMINIRLLTKDDWPAVWQIIEPVFRAGETYAFPRDITEKEAYKIWVSLPKATYVAVNQGKDVLGTYYIKPNQPGSGAHICNCGYIVAENARGQGIASEMCEHSQREAIAQGFRAMQFNLVVSTNVKAVRLWKKLGFEVIGTIPQAFHHPTQGYVDADIMYKDLLAEKI